MRGNEFEKKVQEQMDELHLRPSPSVWVEVEKELRKKKRRRIVFLVSMLAGIGLLGYSGYTLLTQENKTLANQEKETILPADKPVANSSTAQTGPSTSNNNNTTTIGSSLLSPNNTTPADNKTAANTDGKITPSYYQPAPTSPGTDEGKLIVKLKTPSIGTRKPGQQDKYQSLVNQPVTNQPVASVTPVIDQSQPVKDKENSDIAKNNIVQDNKQTGEQETPASISEKKDSAIAKIDLEKDLVEDNPKVELSVAKNKPGKNLNIKWGFELSGGKNFSRTNSFKVPSKSIAQVYFSEPLSDYYDSVNVRAISAGPPQGGLNNGSYGGVLGGGYVRPPSPVRAGPAFKVGVSAEIELTKRSSILTGVRYSYQSEFLYVGQQGYANNLMINRWQSPGGFFTDNNPYNFTPAQAGYVAYSGGYYYGPGETKYTNRYHFLELPLSYQWKVINGKKMQLLWNGGVFASVLLSTNALVYDTASYGIYYKNSKAFNNVHFAFNSGLSARFGRENKLQWSIGPEFSMDMTHVMKSDFILRNRYFLYSGITARVLLPRKK